MTDEDDAATYVTREARTPNGARVIAAFKPGNALERMSDEEFIAEFRKVQDHAGGEGRHLRVVRDDEAN